MLLTEIKNGIHKTRMLVTLSVLPTFAHKPSIYHFGKYYLNRLFITQSMTCIIQLICILIINFPLKYASQRKLYDNIYFFTVHYSVYEIFGACLHYLNFTSILALLIY